MSTISTGCKDFVIFTPCCGQPPIYFCCGNDTYIPDGAVIVWNGAPIQGANEDETPGGWVLPDNCYTITYNNNLGVVVFPSILVELEDTNNYLRANTGCNDDLCPTCYGKIIVTQCCVNGPGAYLEFQLPVGYPVNASVFQYIGANLYYDSNGVPLIPNGCYNVDYTYTTEEEYNLLNPPPPYIQFLQVGKGCGSIVIQPGNEPCIPCTYYYQIINCADENESYCTTSNLSSYINNTIENENLWPVIQVEEYPNKCFYVEQIVSCTSPVPVTVLEVGGEFIGCVECQNSIIVYYELINCNNPNFIIYTSSDLHEYIGKYITLDEYAGECFYVTVASGLVPSDIPVTPTGDTYEDCEACTAQHYVLKDCTGQLPDFVTATDLSEQVGSVIVISTCPETCWEVYETVEVVVNGPVNPVSLYADCPDCLLATLTAKCVSFTNTSEKAIGFEVLYPDLSVNKFTIQSGATLAKDCYLQWETVTGLVVTNYGDCINGECPIIPQPKRRVTPGYDTPACTPDYYENVECNFSEWMYKDVLEKRYGISNCCPEELMKWEIKHEMLMLDSLINPDYTCLPQVNCGCPQPTTCNCSCNSGN